MKRADHKMEDGRNLYVYTFAGADQAERVEEMKEGHAESAEGVEERKEQGERCDEGGAETRTALDPPNDPLTEGTLNPQEPEEK